MSAEHNKRTAIAMHEAIMQGDLETVYGCWADDITFRPMGTHPVGRVFKGRDDIVNNLILTVYSRLKDGGVKVTLGDVVADNETCFVQFSGEAESVSGMAYNNEYVQILKFRDGKVASITEYMDTDLFIRALFSED